MVFCRNEKDNKTDAKIESYELANVTSFKYLGCKFTFDNDCSIEIKNRIALASAAYAKLKPIWRNNRIKIKTKLRVLKTCVFSTLLYGAEVWVLKKQDEMKLDAFEMKCYRWLLEIKWQDHVRNSTIRKLLNEVRNTSSLIKKRQLKWLGHVSKM